MTVHIFGDANNMLNGTPLSHARILYDSVITDLTALGTNANAMLNPLTYEHWESTNNNYAYVDIGVDGGHNALCIASHNLVGSTVNINDGINLYSITVTSLDPIMAIYPTTSSDTSITIYSPAGAKVHMIGVLRVGKTLDMQRPIYAGHRPIALSRVTEISAPRSRSGQALGFTVKQQGRQASYSWSNLPPDWYRENFDPFVEYASRGMGYFFIAWRPNKYPDDTAYGAITGDVSPENSGTAELMNVNINVEALGPYSAK